MLTTEQTLNEIGNSSAPVEEHKPDNTNLASTIEQDEVEASTSQSLKDDAGEAGTEEGKDLEAGKKGKDLENRLDKNPRFQELNTKYKATTEKLVAEAEEKGRLKAEVEFLKQQLAGGNKPAQEASETPKDYEDESKLTQDQKDEWKSTDPEGWEANHEKYLLAKAEERIMGKLKANASRSQAQEAINKVYDEYKKSAPDFQEKWDKGEIQKFMADNPGLYTPMTAHKAMTEEARIEARAKEVLEKQELSDKSKLKASTVLGAGPAASGRTAKGNPELNNIKEKGGLNSVIAGRLRAMRSSA